MRKWSWIVFVVFFAGCLAYGIVAVVQMRPEIYFMHIGIFGIVITVIYNFVLRDMWRARRVLRTGEPATGRVLAIHDTNVTVNRNPMVKLELEVTPQRGSTYVTTARVVVPRYSSMVLALDAELPLKVDPRDPMFVAVDLLAMRVAQRGAASPRAQGGANTNSERYFAMMELLKAAEARHAELMARGLDGEGRVLSAWSLDLDVNGVASGMALLVEAKLPGRPPFKVEVKRMIPIGEVRLYQTGANVRLRYDPAEPEGRITVAGLA